MSGQRNNIEGFPGAEKAIGGARNGGNGQEILQRLTALETELKHLATKKDLEGIKTLIAEKESTTLKWLIGIVSISAISLLAAIIRTFL